MALASLQLDDLTWRDMVESVRRRIPGASEGIWTHHAEVDPGITLLELFAWLIEQRLFWIDQVPDDLLRALFALLGEQPRSAHPASTVLACAPPAGVSFQELPPDVVFRFRSVDEERAFTSRTGVTILPIARMGVRTADGDRSADLRASVPIPLLRHGGGPSSCTFIFWLTQGSPIPARQQKLAMLLQIASPGRSIPAEWEKDPDSVEDDDPAASPVAPPAALTWSISTGPNAWRDVPSTDVEDGSGGLRRSGLVRLPLTDDWQPIGPATTDGQWPFAVRVRTDAATFTSPPVLVAIAANAIIAEHWKTVDVPAAEMTRQARAWLKLPGQLLVLPADEPLPIAPSVSLALRERDATYDWKPAQDLAFADRASRLFVVDRMARALRFGDGVNGRIPVPHDPQAADIGVRYRAGGGLFGNVAPGKAWEATHAGTAIAASNPVAAAGGAEPEAIADAAVRIAGQLARRERAVTRADYEEVALTTPGVAIARAHAVVGLHPLHPCVKTPGAVTVFLVPSAPRADRADWKWPDDSRVAAPVIDPGALAAVRQQLDRARLIASLVFVRQTKYRAVSLRIDVATGPVDPRELERRLGAVLSRYLDPIAGGERDGGLPFGEPVRPSALLRLAQQTLSGEAEVEQVAVGLDGQTPSESCRDVAIGPYELAYLARVIVIPHARTSGGGLP